MSPTLAERETEIEVTGTVPDDEVDTDGVVVGNPVEPGSSSGWGNMGGMAPDAAPDNGLSLQDISQVMEDAFCTLATAMSLTGTFMVVEGAGMYYMSKKAPPSCGTLACAMNPVHCDECTNHWQRLSDLEGGKAFMLLGSAVAAAGNLGERLCDD